MTDPFFSFIARRTYTKRSFRYLFKSKIINNSFQLQRRKNNLEVYWFNGLKRTKPNQ